MGINDDEQPRIHIEITLLDPNAGQAEEKPPQITQAMTSQPEVSPKKEKKVKSYMNPIHNVKSKGGAPDPLPVKT